MCCRRKLCNIFNRFSELKHEEEETNELDHNLITPLVQSVLSFNSYALNVDQSDYDMLNESEIEQAFGKDLQEVLVLVNCCSYVFSTVLF